ncbi:MAG: hypothetical protein JNK87_30445 [Bryobacterales bacterium]|nr:hypothetical protein [Bryobacterales bacterium]
MVAARLAWLLAGVGLLAQDPAVILAPVDGTTVAPGKVRIVARAPGKATLAVDGKPVAMTETVAGVVHAEVELAAGKHEVAVSGGGSEAKISVTVGAGANFRVHPPGLVGCDTCHAVKNEAWALKRATPATVCAQCHDRAAFVPAHTHNTDILADCQNCHLPHGSAAKAHLQKPKETVCKTCHNWPL